MQINPEWQNFYDEIAQEDKNIDLAKASLIYAKSQYLDLNIKKYLDNLNNWTKDIRQQLPTEKYPLKIIKLINQYLFEDLGFSGNTENYYDHRNSYLNEVIDRKTGIPITLAVVYLTIAQNLDFPMVGIGMPGHFLIRPDFEEAGLFVDVFNRGEILFPEDCEAKLSQIYQQPVKLELHFLNPVSKRQILARMLTNLKFIYFNNQQLELALSMSNGIDLLFPDNPLEKRFRGLLAFRLGQMQLALADLKFYLAAMPEAEDFDSIQKLVDTLEK
jgi:regulator of sirC expression with transglutaminase-like and TPR domain